jgi:hypothetical protein
MRSAAQLTRRRKNVVAARRAVRGTLGVAGSSVPLGHRSNDRASRRWGRPSPRPSVPPSPCPSRRAGHGRRGSERQRPDLRQARRACRRHPRPHRRLSQPVRAERSTTACRAPEPHLGSDLGGPGMFDAALDGPIGPSGRPTGGLPRLQLWRPGPRLIAGPGCGSPRNRAGDAAHAGTGIRRVKWTGAAVLLPPRRRAANPRGRDGWSRRVSGRTGRMAPVSGRRMRRRRCPQWISG